MDKLLYQNIDFSAGTSIEEAVKELLAYKEKGVLASGEFNGAVLYSDTVTIDNAYLAIIGKSKAAFEAEQEARRTQWKVEEEAHKESIPYLSGKWIEKGKEVLTEDKWALWEEIVPIRLGDLYRGMELGATLEIVEALNNDCTLEEAKNIIENQGHSGMSFSLVRSMVKEFALRGKEFYDYVS